LNQEVYRRLISGQNHGLSAISLRFCLAFTAAGYSLVVRLRNFLYSKGWLKTHRVNAVVFSIGNITAGGTGKTPLVIWLCNYLTQNSNLKTQNYGFAILTRGYKATQNSKLETRNYGDEPAIIAEDCPQAKVIVNPDRVAGAVEAINKFGTKVLIMDDGFQHQRLARDIDIVTIDATQPFGYGKLLPAGLLREPISELKRADAVVITRCNQITEAKLIELEKKLQQVNPNIIVARSIHAPVCAKSVDNNKEVSLDELKYKKIFTFCGIGNPESFLETIRDLGCELVGSNVYNDHHHYVESDVADICRRAEGLKANLILTTQKDWTKIAPFILKVQNLWLNIQFAYVKIELKFISGEDRLRGLIKRTLKDKIPVK
jgi:tetraacyldisaccharide 4'-kinase